MWFDAGLLHSIVGSPPMNSEKSISCFVIFIPQSYTENGLESPHSLKCLPSCAFLLCTHTHLVHSLIQSATPLKWLRSVEITSWPTIQMAPDRRGCFSAHPGSQMFQASQMAQASLRQPLSHNQAPAFPRNVQTSDEGELQLAGPLLLLTASTD